MQIIVENLHHTYDPKTPFEYKALNGINLTINQGDFIGVIGETGSGKTTLIEHFNGLIKPTKGRVILKDITNFTRWKENTRQLFIDKQEEKISKQKNLYKIRKAQKKLKTKLEKKAIYFNKIEKKLKNAVDTKQKDRIEKKYGFYSTQIIDSSHKKMKNIMQIRSKIGVVFQFAEYQLFQETIEKDIMFGPINMGVPKNRAKKLAKKYLEVVGLPQKYLEKSPFELSGGEKRRVAIAGILAMEPDFLVFDEPTAGLDPIGTRQMLDIFKKLNSLGKTIIMITHNLDDVLQSTKKTLLLHNGKIARFGNTYDILSNIDFLKKNNMEPPQLLDFAKSLKEKGVNVGDVNTIKKLAEKVKYFLSKKNVTKKQKGTK